MSELIEESEDEWCPSDEEDYYSDESDDFFHYDDYSDISDDSGDDDNEPESEPLTCIKSKLRGIFDLLDIPRPEMIDIISNRGDLSQKKGSCVQDRYFRIVQ